MVVNQFGDYDEGPELLDLYFGPDRPSLGVNAVYVGLCYAVSLLLSLFFLQPSRSRLRVLKDNPVLVSAQQQEDEEEEEYQGLLRTPAGGVPFTPEQHSYSPELRGEGERWRHEEAKSSRGEGMRSRRSSADDSSVVFAAFDGGVCGGLGGRDGDGPIYYIDEDFKVGILFYFILLYFLNLSQAILLISAQINVSFVWVTCGTARDVLVLVRRKVRVGGRWRAKSLDERSSRRGQGQVLPNPFCKGFHKALPRGYVVRRRRHDASCSMSAVSTMPLVLLLAFVSIGSCPGFVVDGLPSTTPPPPPPCTGHDAPPLNNTLSSAWPIADSAVCATICSPRDHPPPHRCRR